MKRKSLFVSGHRLIKWHAAIYIGFTVTLWSTLSWALDDANFELNKDLIISRMQVTVFWGIVFVVHFAVHQMRLWWQSREQRSHLKTVSAMQERYISGARLDMDAQNADESDGIDEEALDMTYSERQREQLK